MTWLRVIDTGKLAIGAGESERAMRSAFHSDSILDVSSDSLVRGSGCSIENGKTKNNAKTSGEMQV